MKVIIQGFGSKSFLFEEFVKYFDNIIILENYSNTYQEVENKLLSINEKMDILGWSLGSLYALNFAINHQELVRSIFLISGTARFTEKEGYNNGIKRGVLEKMNYLIKRKKEIVMRDFYSNIFKFVSKKDEIIEKLISQLPEVEVLENGLNALLNYDLIDQIKDINLPVLICNGINDTITPKEGAIVIHERISNSILKLVEGGHSYFLEDPINCKELWEDLLCQIK